MCQACGCLCGCSRRRMGGPLLYGEWYSQNVYVHGMGVGLANEQMTFAVLWNPKLWPTPEYETEYYESLADEVERTSRRELVNGSWSFGTRTPNSDVEEGDRVFMFQVGRVRSVVASGVLTSGVWNDRHWGGGGDTPYVDIQWDRILPPDAGLPVSELQQAWPRFHWHLRSSGTGLPTDAAQALEQVWASHIPQPLGRITEVPFVVATSARSHGPSRPPGPEQLLAERYFRHLKNKGHDVVRHRYFDPGHPALTSDLFDKTANVLIEAKAHSRRTKVRSAVGQLMDYHRFYEQDPRPHKRVLLSSRPDDGTLNFLQAVGVDCAYPKGRTFELIAAQ